MPAFLSNLVAQSARIRGLMAPVAADEPLRRADGGGGAGGATIERKTKSVISLPAGIKATIELGKVAEVLKIASTGQCRVRFYATAAQRDADSGRAQGVAASPFSGLLFEGILTASNLVLQTAPVPTVYCDESTVTRFIPYIIEPYYAETITVTFTYLEIEA